MKHPGTLLSTVVMALCRCLSAGKLPKYAAAIQSDARHHSEFGKHVEAAFEGTGVPLLEDMADFQTGHGCEP